MMRALKRKSGRKRIFSRSSRMRRDVFSYRYLKRNLLVGAAVVGTAVMLAVIIKYGEAADQKDGYAEPAGYVIESLETTMMDENSISIVMDTIHEDTVQLEAKQNDTLTEAASEFDGKFIARISDTLNIRAEASVESEIVGKMFDGTVGDVLEEDGEWTKISSGAVTGYVKTEFILTGIQAEAYSADYKQLIGTITEETVRLRSEMSTEADILDLLAKGTELKVVSVGDEWVEVVTATGQEGYIAAAFISVEETYMTALTIDEYNALYNVSIEEEASTEAENQAESGQSTEETVSDNSSVTSTQETAAQETSTQGDSSQQTSKTENTNTSVDTSNYSDAYLLACLVSMEAGYEPYEGQLAVANVVLNRVNSGYWGSSISSVIYAPNQFPSVTGDVMQNYLNNGPLPTAQQAANDALAGNNNIGSFTSFLNVNYIDTDSLSDYQIIGNHCFY